MNTDLIIIGGGISGCALAYFLASVGVEVILLERSGINSESSGANSGSLHGQIPHEAFLNKGEEWANAFGPTLSLISESIKLWKNIEESLGTDLEVRINGGLLVAKNDQEIKDIRAKATIEKKFGIHSEFLDKSNLRRFAPYLSDDTVGAMFYPEEGKANPLLVTPAFALNSEKLGVQILRQVELEWISVKQNGFLVDTTIGSFSCNRIVNCAGIEVDRINSMVGLSSYNVFADPIQSNITEPIEHLIDHLVYSAGDRLTLKQTVHGSCIIGGGWPSIIDDVTGRLKICFESVMRNLIAATDIVPCLESIQLVRTWPAMCNGTDDWIPILGETTSVKGFFVCVFPWMGFTGGLVSARILADIISSRSSQNCKI